MRGRTRRRVERQAWQAKGSRRVAPHAPCGHDGKARDVVGVVIVHPPLLQRPGVRRRRRRRRLPGLPGLCARRLGHSLAHRPRGLGLGRRGGGASGDGGGDAWGADVPAGHASIVVARDEHVLGPGLCGWRRGRRAWAEAEAERVRYAPRGTTRFPPESLTRTQPNNPPLCARRGVWTPASS